MTSSICTPALRTPPLRRRVGLPAALLSVLLAGCAKPSPSPPPLVGYWQGTMSASNAAVPCLCEIRADGTQSLTLTLPQGMMEAWGIWSAKDGVLTERTTARVLVLGGSQKVVPLASPMETAFAYQLTGDTLTLTQPETQQTLVLTRGVVAKGK